MLAAQPEAPWKVSYLRTAEAIAAVVEAKEPVFEGEDGRKKTAALLVAIAWAESRFNATAVGDQGRSVGLYQLFESNVPTPEGFYRVDILGNPDNATRVAYRMVRYSLEFCGKYPALNRLGAYTGGTCTGERAVWASQYRMKLAMHLYEANRELVGSTPLAPSRTEQPPQLEVSQSDTRTDVVPQRPAPHPAAPPRESREQAAVPAKPPEPKRTAERKASVRRRVELPHDPSSINDSQLPVFRLTPEQTRMIEGKSRR
jgi:L,D-peptidoglycan transpeptidase YkuD (ErfK/YbiS/YcfS/YnhG family)